MARERYLIDDTEDTIHQNQIVPTTAGEKRANWWFYHKKHVIWGTIGVIAVVMIVYSIVSKVKPDYSVAIMTEYPIPNKLQLDIKEHLEQYADDRNGDGRIEVAVQLYRFNTSTKTDYDAAELQASFVKFAADSSAGDNVLFIYDDKSYEYLDTNDMSGFFAPVDGMTEDYILFQDMKGLSNLHAGHYAEDGATDESVMAVLGKLKVSVRSDEGSAFRKEEKLQYREDTIELFRRLRDDKKTASETE